MKTNFLEEHYYKQKDIKFLESYDMSVENTYIISIKDNEISEMLTKRCAKSCEDINQPYKIFYGFDGTSGTIKVPEELKSQSFINFLRLRNSTISPTELACFYSHYCLWARCVEIDKPIVILEHDAVMVKPYNTHICYNSIVYLGGHEQLNQKYLFAIPPHGSEHLGLYRFICRAHAYAIDPTVAKNMISYVIQHGIIHSLDMMLRTDIFSVVQDGIFAYDDNYISTIAHEGW